MSAPAFTLEADQATWNRRTQWTLWLDARFRPQGLSAEDRIAILSHLLAREIAALPLVCVHIASVAAAAYIEQSANAQLARRPDFQLYTAEAAGRA